MKHREVRRSINSHHSYSQLKIVINLSVQLQKRLRGDTQEFTKDLSTFFENYPWQFAEDIDQYLKSCKQNILKDTETEVLFASERKTKEFESGQQNLEWDYFNSSRTNEQILKESKKEEDRRLIEFC